VRTKRRVAFSETDAAGLVHFTYFFRYFEDAEHALWRQAGLSIHADDSPIGWPRISAACEFRRPLKFEDEFEVRVEIIEMTTRTIKYSGEVFRDGERIATGEWKIACVTKLADGTLRATDMPSDVAERLKPFLIPTSDLQPPTSDPPSPTSA
jgi:YbgC/YbaW family acyl-CoA thioester hydrolase